MNKGSGPVHAAVNPVHVIALFITIILLSMVAALMAGCTAGHRWSPGSVVPDRTAEFTSTCAGVWNRLLGREIDSPGLDGCLNQLRAGRSVAEVEADVRNSPEYSARQLALAEEERRRAEAAIRFRGPITVRDGWFKDGTGADFHIGGVSALSCLSEGKDWRRFLGWAADTGFNAVRVFGGHLIPRDVWPSGQTVARVQAILPEFVTEARARGLAVEFTAITDSAEDDYDLDQHIRATVSILGRFDNVLLEAANEYYHPTQRDEVRDAERLARIVRSAGPIAVPWALGAPAFDEPQGGGGVWPIPTGTFVTSHLDRGRDLPNNVRRVRELYAIREVTGLPVVNNEPIGAGEVEQPGRRTSAPWFFFAIGSLERLFAIHGIHHSEAGLRCEVPGEGSSQSLSARAYVAGRSLIHTAAPLARYRYLNVRHPGSPVQGARFRDPDGGPVVRAYSFVTDSGDGFLWLLGATEAGAQLSDLDLDPAFVLTEVARRPHVAIYRITRQ